MGNTMEGRMEHTIRALAELAGVSTRTLRYYDKIGLLKPAGFNMSGYRVYGRAEVDRLQQILFYRELGVPLETIKQILDAPQFDAREALKSHRGRLSMEKDRLETLIANINGTIETLEGARQMTDEEKFAGFKRELVAENERKYGKEARSKYGDAAVDDANQRVLGMSADEYGTAQALERELKITLAQAVETGNAAGPLAQEAADLHRRWLMHFWSEYTPAAHRALAQMYVDDDRFRAHYDADVPGTAAFLRDAIEVYTAGK